MPTLQWKKIVSKNAYVSKLQLDEEEEQSGAELGQAQPQLA